MALHRVKIEKPKSLSRVVAEEIKEAILKGDLRPGDKLVETALTESLGVSRTPLREAFRELAAEGYITVIPHKGAYVSRLSEEEVLEIYAVLSVLEGLATRLATPKLQKGKPGEEMLLLFEEMKRERGRGDVEAYWRANRKFHRYVAETSGNQRLLDLLDSLRKQVLKTNVITLRYPGRLETSMVEHEEILKAIASGNAQEAERLIVRHIELQSEFVIEMMRPGAGE
ncbi:MAG: GntR family transcriptional regulator [bacterium]